MNQETPRDPNSMSENEIRAEAERIDAERQAESVKIQAEIKGIKTVEGLLDRAEQLVPFADQFLIAVPQPDKKYSDAAHSFIIEAWKRIREMGDDEEKTRLKQKADKLYGDYLDMAQAGPQ